MINTRKLVFFDKLHPILNNQYDIIWLFCQHLNNSILNQSPLAIILSLITSIIIFLLLYEFFQFSWVPQLLSRTSITLCACECIFKRGERRHQHSSFYCWICNKEKGDLGLSAIKSTIFSQFGRVSRSQTTSRHTQSLLT